jgi:hypothetical protein
MRGPTSPYGDLARLWGAAKAAYSSAIDAPYAYLVRREGISKGWGEAAPWGRCRRRPGLAAGAGRAGAGWGWGRRKTGVGERSLSAPSAATLRRPAKHDPRGSPARERRGKSALFAADEGQRVYLPPISDHLEVHVRPG